MIQDRISTLISTLGLSVNSFAAKAGLAQPALNGIVSGRHSAPSWPTLEKILVAVPEVSSEWLTRGVGPMFLDEEKQRAYEAERQARAAERQARTAGDISGVQTGDITLSGANNQIYGGGKAGGNASLQAENTRLHAALDKCQKQNEELVTDEKKDREKQEMLEGELRRSKDQIIDLLMGKTDKT